MRNDLPQGFAGYIKPILQGFVGTWDVSAGGLGGLQWGFEKVRGSALVTTGLFHFLKSITDGVWRAEEVLIVFVTPSILLTNRTSWF